jgi:Zn finger protein HypA/HybF involved in hydrogenase expression
MKIEIPQDPPSIEAFPNDDLGKAREIRALRAQRDDLERKLAEAREVNATTIKPTLQRMRKTEHGIRCGIHAQVLVDEEVDLVECAECGAPLVAIDVLRSLMRREINLVCSLSSLHAEEKRLAEEVHALQKKKQALQGDIRKREGKRKCRRCSTVFDRVASGVELERCPACGMPTTGPARVYVER